MDSEAGPQGPRNRTGRFVRGRIGLSRVKLRSAQSGSYSRDRE